MNPNESPMNLLELKKVRSTRSLFQETSAGQGWAKSAARRKSDRVLGFKIKKSVFGGLMGPTKLMNIIHVHTLKDFS